MNKKKKFILFSFILFLFFSWGIYFYVTSGLFAKKVFKKLKLKTGLDLSFTDYSLSPFSSLFIEGLKANNTKFNLKKLLIKTNFFKLSSSNILIKKLHIDGLDLDVKQLRKLKKEVKNKFPPKQTYIEEYKTPKKTIESKPIPSKLLSGSREIKVENKEIPSKLLSRK